MSKKKTNTISKSKEKISVYLYGLKMPAVDKNFLQKIIENKSKDELKTIIIEYAKRLAKVNKKFPKPFNYTTARYLLVKVVQFILNSAIEELYVDISISQKDKEKLYADNIDNTLKTRFIKMV